MPEAPDMRAAHTLAAAGNSVPAGHNPAVVAAADQHRPHHLHRSPAGRPGSLNHRNRSTRNRRPRHRSEHPDRTQSVPGRSNRGWRRGKRIRTQDKIPCGTDRFRIRLAGSRGTERENPSGNPSYTASPNSRCRTEDKQSDRHVQPNTRRNNDPKEPRSENRRIRHYEIRRPHGRRSRRLRDRRPRADQTQEQQAQLPPTQSRRAASCRHFTPVL